MADEHKPTKKMAANAEKGLKLREKFDRGGTEVGVKLGERGGEAVAEECFIGIGLVFISIATGSAKIAEETRTLLAGLGREHLGGLQRGIRRGPRRPETEERASLHHLEADEAVDEGIGEFADDGIKAALGRALGLPIVLEESGQLIPGFHLLCRER